MRLPFRTDWRRRSYHDPEIVFLEDDTYPLIARTWRKANATLRIARHSWRAFTYQASANAVGTLVAASVAYLVILAGGLVEAVPAALIGSLAVVVAAVVVTIVRLAPKQLLRARATELLDAEPGRVVETMKKIYASPKSRFRLDLDLESEETDWQILDGVWDLPELQRTIIAIRFGVPMTLQDIGNALGVTRERVRQMESQAIARVAAYVEAAQHETREDGPDGGEHD
jgi:RNA polymerase sigma factor (sigma-70 family)